MEALIEFGKIILPAGAVLYAMFLTTRMFLNKEYEKQLIQIKIKNNETVLPVRLQAYERLCLFLERISPKNLIVRLNVGEMTVGEFQQVLLHEIREEFGHNLSQQVYMSEQSWNMVKNAMEEIVMLINESAGDLNPEGMSIELARKVFEKVIEKQELGTDAALSFIKNEIQQVF
ncbi:hypothetical protein N7E81_08885 [Reichenbachiella carrageenanivorans]|uniref:Uncharacterized protein n=1 Tax=Reichenbachiella carrageenanivorans TaxID=2979869 RepID=A0ABY6D4X1_9BACT|nr:hypothetical protein [Reichenbachiella carrageenanivorans]UXX81209.1 hypothetical protein N7E81_08885 [Reichenbachiella carrageenanivorans]